jgi:hypothetical protein
VATSLTPDIPVGDLQFYDNYVPVLEAGNWRIAVTHTLAGVETGSLGATQELVVSAPQFAMDTTSIVNQYPPAGSTGQYAKVLPHIVLTDALLPWERAMTGSENTQPWLAVLVLQDSELIGATDSPTRTQTSTVAGFLATDSAVLKPAVTKADDVAGTDPCTFIQIPTSVFPAITPRLEELRFLAHCRQSNIADKAEQGLEQNGLFSVVVGNRFPAVPSPGTPGAQKNIAHLVSLEGLAAYLVDEPSFGSHSSVALISLASWTFNAMPDQLQDFRGLMEQLVGQEYDGSTYTRDNLWLRLPPPVTPIDTRTPAGAETSRRIQDGFVPMQYQFRTGEQTFAWYRGPFTPVLTTPLTPPAPFATADSALIYQNQFGVFDASLATAWEAGRAAALADRAFGQALFDFRRRGHRLTDGLLQRLQSDAFSATQISELSQNTSVQDEFLRLLSADLLRDIGTPTVAAQDSVNLKAAAPTPDADPTTAVRNFLADNQVQATIADLTSADLEPVATWLAKLLLLYPLPFNLLVPDGRLLMPETLRFFYLDTNWLRALFDGAISIGVESSRDSFFQEIMQDLMFRSATSAAQVMRAQRIGVDPPAGEVAENLICGFLLRSAVVSGWPNLAVRGGMNDGTSLKALRMDHLAGDLLLCLFWGVPDFVEFAEPQEGFRFGVDDDGEIPMRQPVANASSPIGTQLANPLLVLPNALRSTGNNVLDLDPGSPSGLVQKIQAALTAAGSSVSSFGPSDFALQMIKSPEAIRFTAQAN